ncbi:AsmA [Rhodopseudomonas palustris HaA2]|uniref:AsmA n=1 Tax=Rhodopseudomonas palustris (strain HaA2) TaxID=316058 RepID=Q2IYH5_RHOP2|nr:AsmA family protein [Rhodopseudomonas palustris]ABD06735.1 AsmA [Rhodopseudomonas palustris HaA2]
MQTTLLGLAIALIVALLAALVGPFVVDWNQFRDQFETEATRLAGAPVRVAGDLDARLLPTPTLRLRDVTIGGANDPGRIRAAKLDVEFSLGALMRGEWRADELSVNGFALDLGLDADGRLDWPASGLSDLAALSIDRLNLTGRIALHDAASRSTLELSDIAFAGDLRAQGTSLRGDGNFLMHGTRYPFRLSAGRAAASQGTSQATNDGTRLHLTVDQAGRGVTADLDGVLAFAGRSPRFEGTAMLSATAAPDGSRTPWRISAKVKADPALAALDQLDVSWGAEERALKLAGSGDVRFGAAPLLTARLAARQLDGDRLLAAEGDDPAGWLRQLRDRIGMTPQPPLPMRLVLDAEQIMLGGRPLTEIAAELRSDRAMWRIDRFALRAPGGSRLALSGGGGPAGASDQFNGTLTIESADPDLLTAWLQGRAPTRVGPAKPLRMQGRVAASTDAVTIDPLTIEADGGTLRGRIATSRTVDRGGRIEAVLAGDRVDLDAATELWHSLAGPRDNWPEQASVALDLEEATSGGQIWRPLRTKFGYGPGTVSLDQLEARSASGVTLQGDGRLDRANAIGRLNLAALAPSLRPIADALDQVAPTIAARLKTIGEGPGAAPGDARISIALTLEADKAKAGQVNAGAVAQIDSRPLKGTVTLKATPSGADIGDLKADALSRSNISLSGKLSAERGVSLLTLLGLDRAIAAGEGGGTLDLAASGAWGGPLKVKAHLTSAALDIAADGPVEPWAAEPKATLSLNARRVDLAPLFDLAAAGGDAARISATSRLAVAGRQWSFNEIDAGLGGARLRGRLALTLGDEIGVDGEAGLDALALGPALQLALGVTGHDPAEPLGRGLLHGWRGKVAFQALRATLPGGAELQPFGGLLRHDGRTLTLDAKGKLGGGDAKVVLHARPGDAGVAFDADVGLAGADASALRYGEQAMPAAKASLQITLDSVGRSASALGGALAGGGTLTLERAQIPGLDPKAFEVAMRAGESPTPIDEASLARMVEPVLSGGTLAVDSAQFPLSLADGRLRVAATPLTAKGARAVISGGYDIPAGQADLRATLALTGTGPGLPPDIRIFAAGPPERLTRNVDLSALSSWLTVQRIDRETKKLESLEQEAKPPALPASRPASDGAAPIAAANPAQNSLAPAAPSKAAPSNGPAPTESQQGAASPLVPLPDADPRRAPSQPSPSQPSPRAATPKPVPVAPLPQAVPPRTATPQAGPPQAATSDKPGTREKLAPLPPALEIKPAPGDARPSRSRPPLVLTPPNNSRAAN